MSSRLFETTGALPRGRHKLSRDEVVASQRLRMMGALVELMSESGYANATIGEVAARATVSRSAFYQSFADKQACLFAAYELFARSLLDRMAAAIDDGSGWYAMVGAITHEYLRALEEDPVTSRAFLVEMDAAGAEARALQRATFAQFAAFLQSRHDVFRTADPTLGPLPASTFLGIVLGTRALVCDRLALDRRPQLTDLADEVFYWITATIEGAAAAQTRLGIP